MARHTPQVSGQELAYKIGRSQNYVAKRLRNETPLTLDDVELIAGALGVPYTVIIAAAVRQLRGE